jgi:hypothetical protein
VNHRPESRMRETRLSGSEGGEAGTAGLPYPYRRRITPWRELVEELNTS